MNLFRFLEDDQIKFINKTRYEVRFHKGEIMFKQGGPFTHIACLTSGMAKIYIEDPEKKNLILKIVKPTEIIGGPGFNVDSRHHFSVAAMEESTACFIDINAFTELVKTNTTFAMEFIKQINTTTINLYNKMMSLTHKQMHGRIADTLLYLSDSIYESTEFETNLSRQDVADLSAMTKESAIRILKEFKEDGIIEFNTSSFHILNLETLRKISKTG
ncbi:MAG: Crp/Fnr family transcriptional regulator [Bacteroidales bacterium]|nr:Crp/Fnr family transcriptional regulator [Bacteroidales bacterium]